MDTRKYTSIGERSTVYGQLITLVMEKFSMQPYGYIIHSMTNPIRLYGRNVQVNYGMLIDADFDNNTGYDGIDYKLEVGWNNQTNKWDKTLTQWSVTKEEKTIFACITIQVFLRNNLVLQSQKRKTTLYVTWPHLQFQIRFL